MIDQKQYQCISIIILYFYTTYAADGRKLSVAYGHSYTSAITETRYYVGPVEFNKGSGANARLTIQRVNLPWGYFDGQGAPYVNLTDYQGNIRAVFSQYHGMTMQTTDYYPDGLPKASAPGSYSRHRYSGKVLWYCEGNRGAPD